MSAIVFVSAITAQTPRYAICVAPVAEVLGSCAASPTTYHNLPCMFGKNTKAPIGRKHQLIFHEIVQVLDEQNNQCLVNLPGVFYETKYVSKPDTTGWVHKSALQVVSPAQRAQLPACLSCDPTQFIKALEGTAALQEPYYEPSLGLTLSAGTRFKIAPDGNLYCYDPQQKNIRTISIAPEKLCVYEKLSPESQRALFVQLVRTWADQSEGPIAYVLGGNSLIKRQKNEHPGVVSCMGGSGYDWTHNTRPATGLDCSGLIVRAAHMVGIPFFYKNSITMARYLPETTDPQLGDIIWIPGHVMVLSDLERGLLVEARGYPHGYGVVQEIPIAEQFAGINTVHDLLAAQRSGKPLKRMNKRGEVVEVYGEFKILSLV